MAGRKVLRLPCQVVERTVKLLFLSLILTVPLPTDRLCSLEKHPYLRKRRPFLTALHTLCFIIALSLLVPSAVAVPAIVTEVVTDGAVPTNAAASKNVSTTDVAAKDVATKEVATKDISKSTQYEDRPSGKPCGKFEPMTNEIWENGMREKMTEWLRQQKTFYAKNPRGTSFANYLLDKFFPSSARTVKSCNLMADCHYGSCHDLDPNIPHQEQQLALYAAENLANFHQGLRAIAEAVKDAAVWVDQQHVGYDKTFTWLDEVRADADKRVFNQAMRNAIILAVVLTVTSIASGLYGAIKEPVRAGISGVIGGTTAGGLAIQNAQAGSKSNFFRNDEAEWGEYWSTASDNMVRLIQATLIDYLDGKRDANGHDIVQILSKGGFHMPFRHDLTVQTRKYARREMIAASIDHMWHKENLWIVAAKTEPNTPCSQDGRIHPAAKVCLEEYPDFVFFAGGIDNRRPKDKERPHVHRFPGLQTLEKHKGDDTFYGLGLEDVVRSSFMNYRLSKNKETDLKTAMDTMTADAIQTSIEKNHVRGFAIAVCYNPGGEAFSSLNVFDGSMNYPCMCGDFPYKTVHSDQNDESDDFAIQSGLVYNNDWWTYCHSKKKKHGMECHSKRKGWNCKAKVWEKKKPAKGICDHGLFKNCVNWKKHKSMGRLDEGWEKRSLSGHESEVMAANASIQLEI